MKLFTKEQFKVMLWKNGGGTTTELFRFPIGDEFKIRLSVANVETDGPFSVFPGIDRHLLNLTGNGVDLQLSNSNVSLTTNSDPFVFSGEENIFCTLRNGKITDFNVMIDPSYGKAIVGRNSLPSTEFDDVYIYDLRQEKLLIYENNEMIELPEDFIAVKIKRAG